MKYHWKLRTSYFTKWATKLCLYFNKTDVERLLGFTVSERGLAHQVWTRWDWFRTSYLYIHGWGFQTITSVSNALLAYFVPPGWLKSVSYKCWEGLIAYEIKTCKAIEAKRSCLPKWFKYNDFLSEMTSPSLRAITGLMTPDCVPLKYWAFIVRRDFRQDENVMRIFDALRKEGVYDFHNKTIDYEKVARVISTTVNERLICLPFFKEGYIRHVVQKQDKNIPYALNPSMHSKPVFDEPVWTLFAGDHAFI